MMLMTMTKTIMFFANSRTSENNSCSIDKITNNIYDLFRLLFRDLFSCACDKIDED